MLSHSLPQCGPWVKSHKTLKHLFTRLNPLIRLIWARKSFIRLGPIPCFKLQARNIISAPIRQKDFLSHFPSGTSLLKPCPQNNSQTKVEWILVKRSDVQLELQFKILSLLKNKLNKLKINVAESWCQFHQRFMSSFYVRIFQKRKKKQSSC